MPGGTLRDLLDARKAEGRRLSLDEAMAIVVPVCVDLKERHDRGETLFVHASAIVRGPDGLMRVDSARATAPATPSDKAALAPELQQAPAPGNSRASVFAVGAMLYEMLTGSTVGPGMRRPKDVDPTLPSALDTLLAKALVGDPAHRPDDLGALASAMHHLAPMKSIPPPDADVSKLDRGDDFEVDVKLSLLPPSSGMPAHGVPPRAAAATPAPAPGPVRRDATAELANLKARLEADTRPRYVVNRDRMDHGPFSSVELLQQIASHTFNGKDILRDELSGISKDLDEWEEFAPFCEHAKLHRDIVQEKKDVAKVEKAEKTAGAAKYAIGAALALLLVAGGTIFIVKKVGERRDGAELDDDPSALALDIDGGLTGKARRGGRGRGGRGGAGGGGGGAGGGSFESALNSNNEELNMGGAKVPDLTQAQLAAPMRNASFVSACGAPDSMKVTVKVAVKMGRAIGVSVYTNPPNPGVASCIDRRVRGITWPANPKTDFVTTTY